jgi:hypothetical protein
MMTIIHETAASIENKHVILSETKDLLQQGLEVCPNLTFPTGEGIRIVFKMTTMLEETTVILDEI